MNTEQEIWKMAVGLPGYSVSSLGRVMNNRTETILSTSTKRYAGIGAMLDGKKVTRLVHRLVAQTFIPNPENKSDVNHKNGIKTDNRVENLEWLTHKENGQHALNVLGRWNNQPRGEANSQAKLTVEKVREIRAIYAAGGATYAALARDYRVSACTIALIISGRRWKHAA